MHYAIAQYDVCIHIHGTAKIFVRAISQYLVIRGKFLFGNPTIRNINRHIMLKKKTLFRDPPHDLV